jgi:hypothetical protein
MDLMIRAHFVPTRTVVCVGGDSVVIKAVRRLLTQVGRGAVQRFHPRVRGYKKNEEPPSVRGKMTYLSDITTFVFKIGQALF